MSAGYVLLSAAVACFAIALLAVLFVINETYGARREIEDSLAWIRTDSRLRRFGASGSAIVRQYLARALLSAVPIGRRLVTQTSLADIERQIVYAGSPKWWRLENVLALKAYSIVGGALAALYVGFTSPTMQGLVTALAIGVVGYELPDLRIRSMAKARQRDLRRSLSDTLDLLTVTVEAGLGFDAAVAQIAQNGRGPIVAEFTRYLREKQIGLSAQQALEALSERSSAVEFKTFTNAIAQADRLGISIAPVLREQTHEMRLRNRQNAQERAQKVPVKILIPLIFLIFPSVLIIILAPAGISIMTAFSG